MTEELLTPWGAPTDAVPPGRYRHYKGGEYLVYGLAHIADGPRENEDAVVYQPCYPVPGAPIAVRSLASWQAPTAAGEVRFAPMTP